MTYFICPYYFTNHLSSSTLLKVMLLNIGTLFLKKGVLQLSHQNDLPFTGSPYKEDDFLEILMLQRFHREHESIRYYVTVKYCILRKCILCFNFIWNFYIYMKGPYKAFLWIWIHIHGHTFKIAPELCYRFLWSKLLLFIVLKFFAIWLVFWRTPQSGVCLFRPWSVVNI